MTVEQVTVKLLKDQHITVELGPMHVGEFHARTGAHAIDDLTEIGDVLMRRIIARAKYDVLREVLTILDDSTEIMRENCETSGRACDGATCEMLSPENVRELLAATAKTHGIDAYWRALEAERQGDA